AKEAPKQETTIQEVKTDKLAHNTKDLSNDISK
ncbi:MAG: NADH:ubiquinone reductase (Na(+)-transporting) subunit E, partial [Capnocytophaga ochracea]